MTERIVLAITKRTAELCGTQSLLHGAGLELVTATSMSSARCVIKAIPLRGVIICFHSWSDEERDNIVSELATEYPEVLVTMRCPGCTGCDEPTHTPGTLTDTAPLTQLIATIKPAKP